MPALEVFWSGYFVLHYMFLKFTVIWRRVLGWCGVMTLQFIKLHHAAAITLLTSAFRLFRVWALMDGIFAGMHPRAVRSKPRNSLPVFVCQSSSMKNSLGFLTNMVTNPCC
jgi:hypothetical protein